MGTITLTFLICSWPYAIIFMMRDNRPVVLQKVVTLLYSNSLINPILYICINKQVRKSIMKMFACQEQDQDRPRTGTAQGPDTTKGKTKASPGVETVPRIILLVILTPSLS